MRRGRACEIMIRTFFVEEFIEVVERCCIGEVSHKVRSESTMCAPSNFMTRKELLRILIAVHPALLLDCEDNLDSELDVGAGTPTQPSS